MSFKDKSQLPRLPRAAYQGNAVVFWTHTFENRAKGWLTDRFHSRFREIHLHTCARYDLACPIYVLMPDHWHLVWMGLSEKSNQTAASTFLRKYLEEALGPRFVLQRQAHDRVIRPEERRRNTFTAMCDYVRQNPVRAELAGSWKEWSYMDAVIPGFPELRFGEPEFWEAYWKIYNRFVQPTPKALLPDPRSLKREEKDPLA